MVSLFKMSDEGNYDEKNLYPYSYGSERSGSLIEKLRARIAPFRFRLAARQIVNELGIQAEYKVLEIGSGLGLLGKEIRKLVSPNLSYYGVEILFDSAERSKGAVSPIAADALALPFPENIFDFVVSTDVFEHLPNPQKAVQEIYRVLKPGGKAFLVIADPSEGRFFKITDHHPSSGRKSDVEWWENLFEEIGFEIDESSKKYRRRDWRRIFNLPFLARLKDLPGFACAFNPVYRPGVYVLKKPE